MRTLLQLLVVYGNRVKVIRSLNRIPYSLAMRSFVGLISKLSEVESIYLRHGLLRADWIPGD